jgi:hypothetical protein
VHLAKRNGTKSEEFALEQGMRARGGAEVQFYSFFNLSARMGRWPTPRPGHFTPGRETRYPLYRRLGVLQGRSGQVRKTSPPTGIRSPDRPARNESLNRLSYPEPSTPVAHISSSQQPLCRYPFSRHSMHSSGYCRSPSPHLGLSYFDHPNRPVRRTVSVNNATQRVMF